MTSPFHYCHVRATIIGEEATLPETPNPWLDSLRRSTEPSSSVHVEKAAPVTAPMTGPQQPQKGIASPSAQLPVRECSETPALWIVGAHGGSGESSLAALDQDWLPANHSWPRQLGRTVVVLSCRSSAAGLLAAQASATQWAAGLVPDVELLGLVIIADAPGRLPRPLRDLAQLVSGGVPRAWSIPWIESWRLGDTSDMTTAPRAVHQFAADAAALTKNERETR